jgi:transmembrane sensor
MDKVRIRNIIERYLNGSATEQEVREIVDWIKLDPDLQLWWNNEFAQTDGNITPELKDKLFEKIREKTAFLEDEDAAAPRRRKLIPSYMWRWVAIICLPLCIAFFAYYNIMSPSHSSMLASYTVKAEKGNRTSLELPDGTCVILNSASKLSYLTDFGLKERRVKLEGEAFFQVKHNDKKEFIVETSDLDVKVLGTVFNVSAYKDSKNIVVVLLEGRVGVFAEGLSHTMKPGEKMEYDKTARHYSLANVYTNDYVEWTKGNLYFEKESLENIMKTFSRIYGVNIRFDSTSLPKEYFTGTIPNGSIQNALSILMLTTHFNYQMVGSDIVIKEK